MLTQRVLTAAALLVILLGALAWSVTAFMALVTVIIAIALAEWLQLIGWGRGAATVFAIAVGCSLFALDLLLPGAVEAVVQPLAALATIVWVLIAIVLAMPNPLQRLHLAPVAAMVLGLVLIVAAWVALIHFLHQGSVRLLSVLVVVWIADTAAYFAGRAFGRRKLAPLISPGKTWAGVYGAVVSVLALSIACWLLFPRAPLFSNRLLEGLGLLPAGLLLTSVVALSIVGDLYESLLKRRAGVKDSSQLLPGHGGVYDRIDALLPALPAAALFEHFAR